MSQFLNKINIILLLILFFSLAIVNSHLLNIFGINFGYYVNGNYEFTKVMFFNILSGIIFVLFGINKLFFDKNKDLILNKNIITYFIIFLFITGISTYFSISPYISLFGNTSKGHGFLMFINLFLLLIVLINQKSKNIKKIFNALIFGIFITAILAIKEYFIPNLDYGDLSNRALGTMGHPNYLSLIILMAIVLLYNIVKIIRSQNNYKIYLLYIILSILILTLLLTKSLFGIILFIFYTYYFIIYKTKNNFNKKVFNYLFLTSIIIFILLSIYFYPEKISSFLSRFYIWKSTINISLDNIKILLFGGGLDTLNLIFNKYKDLHLYIYENIGFTADRPHNFMINIFYHLGLLGLIFFIYLLNVLGKKYIVFKKIYNKKIYLFEIIFIFLLFNIFNFSGIVSYIFLILIISILLKKTYTINTKEKTKLNILKKLFLAIIILYSIIYIKLFSYYYLSEIYIYNNNYIKAIKIFKYNPSNYYKVGEIKKGLKIGKYKSEEYYISYLYFKSNYKIGCENLVKHFPISENYFLCGKIFYELQNKDLGLIYYKEGLNRIPDLWNLNSIYYKNILLKNTISKHRFFSEKYSDLKNILKIVNK